MNRPTVRVEIECIVSGGQTGADRGGLDAAIESAVPHGGWCPRGRLAEDGVIPARYDLRETDSQDYPVRTEKNVLDSDGTLVFYRERLYGGTLLTRRLAERHAKPFLLVDLTCAPTLDEVRQWLAQHQIRTLNIAGPRETSAPGIGAEVHNYLLRILLE